MLRVANERGVPVVPRGSGTNLSAGTVPHLGGIVLVLTRMNRLKEISAGDLVAVCEPGVRTIELARAAAAEGMLFPPDPGSHTTATIGGNVAECSGGLRALKYGVTRDYVLGVEAVLATGEVIRSGGRLVKDVAGYDLRRLLCGSEGTLAVMTELTLRLMPAPEETGTGMAYFGDLADAARAVSRVLASGVLPVTLEFLDRVCIDAVEGYAEHRARPRRRRAADLRPGRRPRLDRPRHAADGRRVRGRGRDARADRRVGGRGRRGPRRPAARSSRRCAASSR